MRIITIDAVKKEAYQSSLFTSPEVTLQTLLPDSEGFNVNVVHFGRGVRNKFHTHDSEQILIVTSGQGFIATETEKKLIRPGDVVIIPRGEKHWHGATDASEFSHIYVSRKGIQVTQLEE